MFLVGAGAVLGALALVETIVRTAELGVPAIGAIAWCGLALLTTVPLAVPRPALAAVAGCAAMLLSLAVFRTGTVAGVVAPVLALHRFGRTGAPVAAVLPVPFVVLALVSPGQRLTVLLACLAPAAALAGIALRARAEARVHSAAREVVAGTLLEHTARGERARIARELHDVVAHHISMIAVQAETARLTIPGMPSLGAQRLQEIGDTARAGLTEMRRLLGVLRTDADADVADRHPQPGLEQLNELLDETRDATGTAARLIISGAPVGLAPGVELAAYRIIQEALTNTRRHAPGAAVDVELRYRPGSLWLRVRDNGPGPPAAPAEGHGLLGMRERAGAVGGRLSSGPSPVGGFVVEATLPTGTDDHR